MMQSSSTWLAYIMIQDVALQMLISAERRDGELKASGGMWDVSSSPTATAGPYPPSGTVYTPAI